MKEQITSKTERVNDLIEELCELIKNSQDSEIPELLSDAQLDKFLRSILELGKSYKRPMDYFIENKNRLRLLALLRLAIHRDYCLQVNDVYLSPETHQWYDDGVMYLRGPKPFEGYIYMYQDNKVKLAVVARDIAPGESLGKDAFTFVNVEDYKDENNYPNEETRLEEPLNILNEYLKNKINDESKYQELFSRYPWILGLNYRKIQRHEHLDEKNIPDFTGVRVHDGCRDIIELKPPFMQISKRNGKFNSKFHEAYDQAERYLTFVMNNSPYLHKEKGLRFENAKCTLILGYNVENKVLKRIRDKAKLNPFIEIKTYNDILAWMKGTINSVKVLIENKLTLSHREKD